MSSSEQIGLVVTSHSIDGTFESCPRRFEFYQVWEKVPAFVESGWAADVGTALHEATQGWARMRADGVEPETALNLAKMRLLREWPWLMEEYRASEGLPIGERTLGNALLILQDIVSHEFWQEWELVKVDNFGWAIEIPWRIIHESIGLVKTPYGMAWLATQGKIDFILRNKRTGEYMVVDLKTTVKPAESHATLFRWSGQAGLYAIVLAHVLGLPWKEQGLRVNYFLAAFASSTSIFDNVIRPMIYTIEPSELEDMIDTKLERLIRMRTYANRGHWPRRQHGCDFYGKPCAFFGICGERDEKTLKNWFEFDIAKDSFEQNQRVYAPIWEIRA